MRTRQTMTVSLPPAMIQAVETVRKLEHRTRSELLREALRTHFASRRFPEVMATPSEVRAIERGRAEIKRGDYVTLEQLLHELGRRRRSKSTKSA
jgi:predicted transcriptional regulator